ncbi:MAG TPA: branched-chain amino acid ABC transporter permease [Chloroflexota bacterium]|nr:branched-chain amino acid ABC transporter permease [Chloroflexota bacterium]
MTVFLQYIAGGLAAGSLYALAALGLTLIYKTTGVVNFAHGEMAMVSTFVAYLLLTSYHVPYVPAFLGALLFAALLGVIVERSLMRRVHGATVLTQIMVTLGLFLVLNGAMSTRFFEVLPFPQPIGGSPLDLAGVRVSLDSLLILGLAAALMLGLYLFFRYTLLGIALRATAQNLHVARLMGVRVGRVYATTWAVAAVLGAVAGMLIAPSTGLYTSFMGDVAIKAFAGAILGGLGSLPGAVLGSLLLGVMENLIAGYVSTELKAAFAFSVILLVLVVRPEGIMGAPVRRRI